ncbi:phosphotransferase [Cutibacterium sp. WCA-380-WT-3A]|uniref:Phosphotransferase n=1 Tax=Cutibacterium porci TaxID=2605781 RepID=A0A7K0J6Z2_9ACTN|nr:phosphotransferase [Cutibacterium porci]MSS45717.1 phosphotransferase [Cutibacterium porci]
MGLGWLDDAAFTLGTELSLGNVLREGVRTSVARCWVDGSTTATAGARTVVAKCFRSTSMAHNSGGLGIVREVAGLGCLPHAPQLYAADLDMGVVVMEDIAGTTLESILTGNNPAVAFAAAQMWGRATARVMAASMQNASARVIPLFQDAVRHLDPQTRSAGGPASPRLPGRGLKKMCAALEIAVPDNAELELFQSLRGTDGAEVVTQADPCPGNVLIATDGARFVDYEATSIHHPAVDVVNLVMPWSSCDGLVGVPTEFIDAIRDGFLNGSRYARSWLSDEPMIGLAGAADTLQLTELSLDTLRRHHRDRRSDMARRAMVHRWTWVATHGILTPVIADLCGRMAHRAIHDWGWPEHLTVASCFTPATR